MYALLSSNRYYVELTLTPHPAQMAVLVEAQDVQVIAIEQNAAQTNQDMEKGLEHTKAAVVSARNARKWRWWCFG